MWQDEFEDEDAEGPDQARTELYTVCIIWGKCIIRARSICPELHDDYQGLDYLSRYMGT